MEFANRKSGGLRSFQRGRIARTRLDGAQWELGDLAAEVVVQYRVESLQHYARKIGVEYRTLCNYRRVANRYESSRRRESLSWSHHECTASLAPAAADLLLQRAQLEGWGVRRLVSEVEVTRIRARWQHEHGGGLNDASSVQRPVLTGVTAWAKDLAEAERVVSAIKELASIHLLPIEAASLVGDDLSADVERHLEISSQWLSEFAESWKQRWAR
jgi:hypothetical protein